MDIYEQLIRDEGLRLKPYRDTVGKLTIGIGRNLDNRGITEGEATFLLNNDVADVMEELENLGYSPFDTPRYFVLVNMGFNLGIYGLMKFRSMLLAYKEQRWKDAADHMRNSLWAKQVGERAERLARQMERGIWE